MSQISKQVLFGRDRSWRAKDWTDSDDRVRGGKSQSYLNIDAANAIFCGNLDIQTLGGAGFASQRTTGSGRHWDLSSFDGIEILLQCGRNTDQKRYTFILKDEILPRDPDTGREQSTLSWEYDFQATPQHPGQPWATTISVVIPWNKLEATYRGKPKKDVRPLSLNAIRRMSIMMRSFFGTQEGTFTLELISIAAFKSFKEEESAPDRPQSISSDSETEKETQAHDHMEPDQKRQPSIWIWLLNCCGCKL